MGILDFDEGRITVDGDSVTENPIECKKKLAYIPDNPDIYDSSVCRSVLCASQMAQDQRSKDFCFPMMRAE